jgi:F-type H+-transporting ATPase subunit gamma
MQSKQKLKHEMQETLELSGLVTVYQEIAATKIKSVKKRVEQSRAYWESLHLTMTEVGSDLTVEGDSRGAAIVWLASEQGLYGGVVQSTRHKLLEIMKEYPGATIYVAGKRGRELFQEWWPKTEYKYLALPEEELIKVELDQLVQSLPSYQELVVIYGKMLNLLTQEPEVKKWQPIGSGTTQQEQKDKKRHFLYEPEADSIGQFLGSQVTIGILTQLTGENKLAKLAARIMSLEETMAEVDKSVTGLKRQLRRAKSRDNDKKQQARITHQKARRNI